jgi:hypothetical protein
MLEFLKRLFISKPAVKVEAAPYKVEAPTPVVEPAPVIAPSPTQVAKKAATGSAKSTAKKGAETGAKPARRRKKPATE